MTQRRTVYLYPDDLERLELLKARYGLGTSAACRAGVALLLAHLQDEDRQAALDTTVGPIRRKEKEMATFQELTESIVIAARKVQLPTSQENHEFVLARLRNIDSALWELIDIVEDLDREIE